MCNPQSPLQIFYRKMSLSDYKLLLRGFAIVIQYECREYQEALNILDFSDSAILPLIRRMSFANQSIQEPETSPTDSKNVTC